MTFVGHVAFNRVLHHLPAQQTESTRFVEDKHPQSDEQEGNNSADRFDG